MAIIFESMPFSAPRRERQPAILAVQRLKWRSFHPRETRPRAAADAGIAPGWRRLFLQTADRCWPDDAPAGEASDLFPSTPWDQFLADPDDRRHFPQAPVCASIRGRLLGLGENAGAKAGVSLCGGPG